VRSRCRSLWATLAPAPGRGCSRSVASRDVPQPDGILLAGTLNFIGRRFSHLTAKAGCNPVRTPRSPARRGHTGTCRVTHIAGPDCCDYAVSARVICFRHSAAGAGAMLLLRAGQARPGRATAAAAGAPMWSTSSSARGHLSAAVPMRGADAVGQTRVRLRATESADHRRHRGHPRRTGYFVGPGSSCIRSTRRS